MHFNYVTRLVFNGLTCMSLLSGIITALPSATQFSPNVTPKSLNQGPGLKDPRDILAKRDFESPTARATYTLVMGANISPNPVRVSWTVDCRVSKVSGKKAVPTCSLTAFTGLQSQSLSISNFRVKLSSEDQYKAEIKYYLAGRVQGGLWEVTFDGIIGGGQGYIQLGSVVGTQFWIDHWKITNNYFTFKDTYP